MSKDVILSCYSTPEHPNSEGVVGMGYHDKVTIVENNQKIYHEVASGCPNCWSPGTGEWWEKRYGWAGPGAYPYECIQDHPRFGKCLLINEGGSIVARNRNPNHAGKRILTQVFMHAGGTGNNPDWRGSGGCPTMPEHHFEDFMLHFEQGQRGRFTFIDSLGPRLYYV